MDRILFPEIRQMLPSKGDTVSFLRDTDLGNSFELELCERMSQGGKGPDLQSYKDSFLISLPNTYL